MEYSPHRSLNTLYQEESDRVDVCEVIEPAFPRVDAAVCLVASNEYAPFAAVVIQSIIENAKRENNYDIVVFTDDMFIYNRERIEAQAKEIGNISIRVMDITKIIENLSFYTWAQFTPNTYYRLLAPDLFAQYPKVIYLDSDIVVNHDIADLYATELDGYYMAAAYDTHVVAYCTQTPPLEQRAYNKETLQMKHPEQYFQAGIALYNVTLLNKTFEKGYLIEEATKHQLKWLDQDLVNMLFQDKIKRLPNKWNVMIANVPYATDEYYLPADLRKEYYQARLDPYIVHYVGKAIPCFAEDPDLYEFFWFYARKTVFYELLLQKMCAKNAEYTAIPHVHELYRRIGELEAALSGGAGAKPSLKKRIKALLMPIFNLFFPKGSDRRYQFKRSYFRLRGWEL